MSYILEALRRAEAERQRGAVPHLHAQPALAGASDPSDARRPPWGLWLAVAVAALLLVSAAGWFLARDKSVAPPQATAPVQPPPTVTAPPPAPLGVAAVPAVVPVPLGMAALPPPMPMPMPIATPSPLAVAAKAAASAAPAVARPPAQASSTAAPVPAAIPSLAELPAALRQGLPPLSLGGIVHSAQAAQRLVILNGQVLHEGDRPTPELQVEQIRPRSVVLNFRGQAFELAQ